MRIFRAVVGFMAGSFLLAGLGAFGYQVYVWYRSGEWFEMDLLRTVQWLHSTRTGGIGSSSLLNWFIAPQDWLGLHRFVMIVFEIVPLALFLIVIGSFLFAAIDRGEKERRGIIDAVEKEMRARQAGEE